MHKIEPYNSWLPLAERAESETNPRHKKLLTEVRNHMEHEIKGDLEPLMSTLTAEPVYHFWGNDPSVLEGRAAVEGFYSGMIASGTQQFEVVVERIIVDDGGVITEGQVKQVYKGEMLKAMGMETIDDTPVEADDLFLTTTQLVTVWPADPDAKLVGEDIYFGHDPFRNVERVARRDLPDYFKI
ncbi:MAG: nuclear transport factor 2 family protein, partial [Gammaproteobacteria bacterium]|nr:nuclear transport factor 2 family protein [Gammaproteobacteria bacterium]